jgi:hypothetical protein
VVVAVLALLALKMLELAGVLGGTVVPLVSRSGLRGDWGVKLSGDAALGMGSLKGLGKATGAGDSTMGDIAATRANLESSSRLRCGKGGGVCVRDLRDLLDA